MAKGKTHSRKTNRPSTNQIIFAAIAIIIILSWVLSLIVKL
jgi:hypothetical protein